MTTLKSLFRAAVLVAAALCVARADAASIGTSISERVDARSAVFFRVGVWSPTGKELKTEFGPRIAPGAEIRALSRYGVGGSLALDCWWAMTPREDEQDAVSLFLPGSASLFYAYPLLDSAVTPYAGLLVSASFGSLCLPQGDSLVRAQGFGSGLGMMLGAEVPLVRGLIVRGEMRLSGGRLVTELGPESGLLEEERRRSIRTSNFAASLGLTMGFNDLFFF